MPTQNIVVLLLDFIMLPVLAGSDCDHVFRRTSGLLRLDLQQDPYI